MKSLVRGISAVILAALAAGCAYSDRTYAVAAPGAEYYGDRYYSNGYYYYPGTGRYVRAY